MCHHWEDTTGQIGKRLEHFAAIIIIPLAGLEATYLATAPDSMVSSEPAPDSMWILAFEVEEIWTEEHDVEYRDGATETFYFDVPSDAVIITFILNYSESNEGGVFSSMR